MEWLNVVGKFVGFRILCCLIPSLHSSSSPRSWYKTMKYEILHTGGFVRLVTLRGRSYWNAQNETEHTSPDWKFHVSCHLDDLPRAWNSISALFMDMKCEIGLKATTLNSTEWSDQQRGREITIYIYRYHHSYRGYMQGVLPEHDHELYLGTEYDQIYTTPFWYNFVREIERRCAMIGIRSRGVADGDLLLPGCGYVSLRNEAFVPIPLPISDRDRNMLTESDEERLIESKGAEGEEERQDILIATRTVLAYPPNHLGWNAANHPNPLLDLLFFLRQFQRINERIVSE